MIPEMTVADFLDLPEFDVAGAVSLGVALLGSLPAGAPESVRQPAHSLRALVLNLQAAWADRNAARDVELCLANARLGNAWMALHSALRAATRLPALRERSQLGSQLLISIFPDGLEFLAQASSARVKETTRRLDRIESERSWRAISLVTGHPEFLEVLKEAHEACHAALTDCESHQAGRAVPLDAELREFRTLASQYVLQLAAWCRQSAGPGERALQATLETLTAALVVETQGRAVPPSTSLVRPRPVQSESATLRTSVTPHTPVPDVA